MVNVRLRLKELMTERKVNQQELADAIGVPQGTLSRWVGNKVDRYDRRILNLLIEYFKCEITDLIVVERTELPA